MSTCMSPGTEEHLLILYYMTLILISIFPRTETRFGFIESHRIPEYARGPLNLVLHVLLFASGKLSAGVSPRFYRWVTETADYIQRGNEHHNLAHIDEDDLSIGSCLHLISVNLFWPN